MSITNPLKRAFGTSRSILAKVPTQNLREAKVAPPFPVIETCPAPTCTCRPMPDLDIDPRPFDRTIAPYAEHVLVHTGLTDWPSRIEDDERNTIAREMRELFKPASKYYDVRLFLLPHKFPHIHDIYLEHADFYEIAIQQSSY